MDLRSGAAVKKWRAKVEHVMACNCNFGCPCSFDAPPTYGSCETASATRIVEGTIDGVVLDGLKYVVIAKWPGPLHLGHGRAVVLIDERARGDARTVLEAFATGKLGGPWGVLASTLTGGVTVRGAKIEYRFANAKSRFAVADVTEVALEPIRNPVSGAEHVASALLPTGLLTKREDFHSSTTFWARTEGLEFSYPERNALTFTTVWKGP